MTKSSSRHLLLTVIVGVTLAFASCTPPVELPDEALIALKAQW
jgi:hypothetical protein